MAKPKVCSIDGCGKTVFCRGWCSRHYHRWQRYGDPFAGGPERQSYLRWLEDRANYLGDECLTWPFFKCGDGRPGALWFRSKQTNAARVMCFLAHGDPPFPKAHAAHSCGNGHLACVNPRHLRWATAKQNQLDRYRDGTDIRGERHPNSHLSSADVRKIRQLVPLLRGRMSHSDIGKLFDTTGSYVWAIVQRRVWAWLED